MNKASDNYAVELKAWQPKVHGPKPSEAELSTAHAFGKPGKQSLALALALREGGVTGDQMKLVSALRDGKPTPHLNHMKLLVKAGSFTRAATPGVYKVTLTPTGKRWVEKATLDAKPVTDAVKAEGATKATPKAKATDKPTVKAAKAKPVKAAKAKGNAPKPDNVNASEAVAAPVAPSPVTGEQPAA